MSDVGARLQAALCVVAHPDDEVLWFASLLRRVGQVITVHLESPDAPGLGERRARAMAGLPYAVIPLGIAEAGTYGAAHWRLPSVSEYGLKLDTGAADADTRRRYVRNFHTIRERLSRLIPPGATVYTHNPWGEYGHADHVQVYRVLESLSDSLLLTIRVPAYVSAQSESLAARYRFELDREPEWRAVDVSLARQAAAVYRHHSCWTWAEDWSWDACECFLPNPALAISSDGRDCNHSSVWMRRIPFSVAKRISARFE